MYCVVFFQEKQGFSGYKLQGPVRDKHVDYHILSKITPDATDRTKKSNATKFQIFQLTIRELSRMHCLNLFQFGGDASEGHVDCDLNAQHITSVIEKNFKAPVVSKISVGYLNRENFESQFKNRPLHDFPLKFATWHPHDSKHHETPTQKWGIKKDSAEYHRICSSKTW